MPPELPNEQELILKKRARRRLVGAIALVLIMIIVLPMILKDRTVPDSQESIKINMPETATEDFNSTVVPLGGNIEAPKPAEGAAVPDAPADLTPQSTKSEPAKPEATANIADVKTAQEKPAKPAAKPIETNKPEPSKTAEVTSAKNAESFTVQIGVFSDAANVKQLQDKLKQAGYSSRTEKISTPKGEKIRLRAGTFSSRQDADTALSKMKQAGLSGLVMPNS